ncbi:hypothetical protein tinsulaeT_14120 [Thalassotalea insulae]|uniref:EAL domain-containing protein n=1 Tax=Thalassotalea insulae TaxID=2056778 RepID=A0ABQ6GQ66_9GAMM|nr:GGDEF domain-containing phosphodiesterase [Thalassotalea insulae]GLX78072.1 hypothetical protein tinsulaeT_14120 [Thalassotalea insulae]
MVANVFALSFLFLVEAIVFGVLAYLLHSFYQSALKRYAKFWCYSLVALSVHFAVSALQHALLQYSETSLLQVTLTCIAQISQYLFVLLFCFGCHISRENIQYNNANVYGLLSIAVLLGAFCSLLFAFNENGAFSRFYLRESLADLIFAGVFLITLLLLLKHEKRHFVAKLFMIFSAILTVRYFFSSFISIVFVNNNGFGAMFNTLVYFDFGAFAILGYLMLLWMHSAERNTAERAINRATYLGKHDQLTGALNREQVIEKLPLAIEQAVSNRLKLQICLIDLKRFKFVNDSFGLKTGDMILGEIANRLSDSIFLPKVVGRLSGDSFIFALEISEDSQQEKAAKHLHDLISRPCYLNHQEIHLQASVGYCLAPVDSSDAEELLQQANLALFQAESHNVASVKYKDGMQSHGRRLVEAEKTIRQALAQQEFILYFQPQLNLLTNRIDGVEALVRWQHPEKGLLAPGEFLSDIAALGLSGELDNYVLELACQTNARWYQTYRRRVAIAVNLSATEFQDPKLIAKIQTLLLSYDIPPKYLELEITEDVVITDIRSAMDTIFVLQNMGIKVSIDDFGTGYSSLAYLRDLPIDKIKIDRSFITEFAANDSDLTIVKSMIRLSHGLGKRVLAEGVESIEQLNLLRKLGCDAVQGYFINPPLPEEKFVSYLTRK